MLGSLSQSYAAGSASPPVLQPVRKSPWLEHDDSVARGATSGGMHMFLPRAS